MSHCVPTPRAAANCSEKRIPSDSRNVNLGETQQKGDNLGVASLRNIYEQVSQSVCGDIHPGVG